MYAQRLVSFFLFFLTLGLFTVAAPTEAQTDVAKRQDADGLTQVFQTLSDKVKVITPQIGK